MSESTTNELVTRNKQGVKTLTSYIIGLVLSLLLTVTAFTIVGRHMMTTEHLYIYVMLLAIIQLFVQIVCFLRLNASPEGRWELMPFIFAVVIVLVLVTGSIWIMLNLNYHMMH
ncbi:MAG: cytochrome o ubiquinol oxidase subunit IV [Psychromonas sp.]|nr:cytochrome o ubiquinol oxidase subunit IV [Psychromonas sp.]